ncbi:MAG TPA: transporter substrate-binding domain-containing protein [Pseudolabrys sp.]|nr:transporter substrate-binding domain-containing protein [Pseudolabrys sp.]
MRARQMLAAGLGFFILGVAGAPAQQTADPRIADIVHARKLRVALGLGSPALAIKDPSGEVHGPAMDLAVALATRMGVDLKPVQYPRPGAVLDGLANHEWDVTFLVADPARAAIVDFSPPYMLSDFTYLVPASSTKKAAAEMDQQGVRIAVPRNDASDLRLTKIIQHAELVRVDSIAAALDLVRGGQAEAYAGPRVVLLGLAGQVPGARVLDDGFADIAFAAMVPKGKAGHLAYVSEFIEAAKAGGLVKQAIDQAHLHGVKVAPPRKAE